jgi:nicotinamidase-related amidase
MTYSIRPKTTALLIIDAQREYFDEDKPLYTQHAAEILGNLVKLRDSASEAGIRTIFIRHAFDPNGIDIGRMGDFNPTPVFVDGTPGVEFASGLAPLENDIVVEKTRYSAFVNTKLESVLKTLGIDTVIVTGLMTNFCCVTTARHAHDLDYRVIFVADAVAGPDMPDLGFGSVTHEEVLRVVATSLAGGIADVVGASELIGAMDAA